VCVCIYIYTCWVLRNRVCLCRVYCDALALHMGFQWHCIWAVHSHSHELCMLLHMGLHWQCIWAIYGITHRLYIRVPWRASISLRANLFEFILVPHAVVSYIPKTNTLTSTHIHTCRCTHRAQPCTRLARYFFLFFLRDSAYPCYV